MSIYHQIARDFGIKPKFLTHILYGSGSRDDYYKEIHIPKNGGGTRILHAVQGRMRMLQRMLYHHLSEQYEPSRYATGFVPNKNIVENARIHRKNKVVLKYDIKDFFPSISFPRVRGMFMQLPFGFSQEKATTFAQICCLDNGGPIPQGAVTSPYISNMICRKLDSRLAGYAKKNRLKFSRYADDMAFSSKNPNVNAKLITKHVRQILKEEGFILNEEKTKVLTKDKPQSITGILVNDGLNLRRTYIRNIRAALYKCETTSILAQALEFYKRKHGRTLHRVKENGSTRFLDGEKGVSFAARLLKDQYIAHIVGKIHFYGFVARANKNLNPDHYKTRKNLYNRLLERLNGVLDKEKIRRVRDFRKNEAFEDYFQASGVQSTIDAVLQMNEDELDTFIRDRQLDDVRFFINRITSRNFEVRRNKTIKLLKSSQLDPERTLDLFQYLKDSEAYVLGRLVHEGNKTTGVQIQEFMDELLDMHPSLPKGLAYETKKLLLEAEMRLDVLKKDECDFWGHDENWRINHIYPYMQRVRFHRRDPNVGTDLVRRLAGKAKDLEDGLPPEERKIVISNQNLRERGFYTDTKEFLGAIEWILKSMLRSTNGTHIYAASAGEPGRAVLVIYDDNPEPHFEEVPQRADLANGKIRAAIRKLYGLAHYSIIYHCEDVGWHKTNMFTGEVTSIEESVSYRGYTHKIEIPQVI
jgi:hypothetical protein